MLNLTIMTHPSHCPNLELRITTCQNLGWRLKILDKRAFNTEINQSIKSIKSIKSHNQLINELIN